MTLCVWGGGGGVCVTLCVEGGWVGVRQESEKLQSCNWGGGRGGGRPTLV